VRVRVEWTLRPYGSKSDGIQRFDRPFLRVVCQFDDLIRDGLAEADAGPSTRTVGFTEHHPPLVALGAIILRSPRFDTRLYPEVLVRSSTTGASASSSSACALLIMTQRQRMARSAVASRMAHQSVNDP
jgi:hypothetical protein